LWAGLIPELGVNGLNDYFLQSERLGLRHWRDGDLPFALELWTNPVVTKFISTKPFTANDVRLRLNREIETQATNGMQYWPVFLLGGYDFVGCCGLRPRAQEPGIPEFGVHLLPRHWRHGYAAEAASLVFAHAFRTLGFRALFAGHNPNNAASRALLLRLGFSHTHDEFYPPTGLVHPSYKLAKYKEHT
jgi:RimJ/RimL family protein N-acetyltransferase